MLENVEIKGNTGKNWIKWLLYTQLTFTCSKSVKEILEKVVKYVQSKQ